MRKLALIIVVASACPAWAQDIARNDLFDWRADPARAARAEALSKPPAHPKTPKPRDYVPYSDSSDKDAENELKIGGHIWAGYAVRF